MGGGDPPLSSGVGHASDRPDAAAAPSGASSLPVQSSTATLVIVRDTGRPRRVCDGVAAGLWRGPIEPSAKDSWHLSTILRASLPQFCHVWVMGQILLLHRPSLMRRTPGLQADRTRPQDPAAAARGILLGLALSCLAWIGLALLVPRLW